MGLACQIKRNWNWGQNNHLFLLALHSQRLKKEPLLEKTSRAHCFFYCSTNGVKGGTLRGEIVSVNYKISDGKVAIEIMKNLETSMLEHKLTILCVLNILNSNVYTWYWGVKFLLCRKYWGWGIIEQMDYNIRCLVKLLQTLSNTFLLLWPWTCGFATLEFVFWKW